MKASKIQAGYTPTAKKNLCANCAHYEAKGACTKVQGAIDAGGSCTEYFEPANAPSKGKKGR